MKILAITQARVVSSRLPQKIMKTINGESLLSIHLKRILGSKRITKLKVATTTEDGVEHILNICNQCGVEYYQGSLNDVLERFYETANPEQPDYVVRLTSDCPLIDPVVIDLVIDKTIESGCDYASNTLNPTYPDGIDVEVFKFRALEKAFKETVLTSEREHVTPYIWKNSSVKGGSIFNSMSVENETDYSAVRLTVDTQEDFEVVEQIIKLDGTSKGWLDYVNTLSHHPEIRAINQKYQRNEGYQKSVINDK